VLELCEGGDLEGYLQQHKVSLLYAPPPPPACIAAAPNSCCDKARHTPYTLTELDFAGTMVALCVL